MKISDDVLGALSLAAIDGPLLRIEHQLDRKLYVKVNQVLEACGGKWERKVKAHRFDGDAAEWLEVILNSGEVTTAREIGFFPTPVPLARELVEMANVKPGHIVLEPSAGDGAIVEALLERGAGVHCVERDPKRRTRLWAQVAAIHDWSVVTVSMPPLDGDQLDDQLDDFMEYRPDEPFDAVVMNPPFCKVGLGDHLDHVRRAFSMLMPGGILVSVLPAGVRFRQDRRHNEFREWALTRNGWWDDLPDDSFKESGTSVRTCVLRVEAS